jgi:monomeric sarcosine oxidase
MTRTDAIVIGGGAMGTAAARSLAERGMSVVLLEQFELGHDRGSTAGPTRILRLAYTDPFYVELAARAITAWRRLEQAAEEELLVNTGGLDAGFEADLCARAMAEAGAPHRWLTPEEAADRYPWLSAEGLERVLHHPDAGVCLAKRAIAAQARLARKAGAEVLPNTRAMDVHVSQDRVIVETPGGELSAGTCVVTAGAWGPGLLGRVHPVHLDVTLTHVAYFRAVNQPLDATFVETADVDANSEASEATGAWYSYVVPDGGSGAGVKVGQMLGRLPIDAANGPFPVDQDWVRAHEEYVRRRLPGLAPQAIAAETCFYAATPDDDFVIDRHGPVVIGIGFGGHGFKFTPLVGELLADLATGSEPAVPLDRFSARRPTVTTQR